jgi:prepilin-type processing-associated H-X9-DG protein
LDYFKDLADVQKSFRKFASLSSGSILANGDDPHVVQALDGMEYVSFGFDSKNRIHADNICPDWRHLDVICDGVKYCHLDLAVVGRHNDSANILKLDGHVENMTRTVLQNLGDNSGVGAIGHSFWLVEN